MKTAVVLLFILIISGFFFTSCEENDCIDGREVSSLVGKTFEGCGLSITFESADSVRFYSLHYPYDSSGKAWYFYRGHIIEIMNPHNGMPQPEQVKEAYFYDFVGEINSADKLEHVRFLFIGPGEHLHIIGNDMTLWRVKDKEQ